MRARSAPSSPAQRATNTIEQRPCATGALCPLRNRGPCRTVDSDPHPAQRTSVSYIRSRLTYANVMSSLAVFAVLGGTGYAVTQIDANSVGTKQLKKNAVVSKKVKDRSLLAKDFK